MKRLFSILLLILLTNFCMYSEDINFPPELSWWIYELKEINNNVEINGFTLYEQEVRGFTSNIFTSQFMTYPVFMRWNYSGNLIAYYNFNDIMLRRQSNGKYKIYYGDIDSHLVFADGNKNIFFIDSFGSISGIDAYHWLTDTVLVAVGSWVNMESKIDLFIKIYTINVLNNTVEIKTYQYKNAITVVDRNNSKLRWYEQREDYFEVEDN